MFLCPVCEHAQIDAGECEVCGKRLGAEIEPPADTPVSMPDLEATRAVPVDVDVVPTPDLEPTLVDIPGDTPMVVPAVAVCRYCRVPAAVGERICGRCGMRLPVARAQEDDAPAAESRRCSCGMIVRGGLCPSCGARHASPA